MTTKLVRMGIMKSDLHGIVELTFTSNEYDRIHTTTITLSVFELVLYMNKIDKFLSEESTALFLTNLPVAKIKR